MKMKSEKKTNQPGQETDQVKVGENILIPDQQAVEKMIKALFDLLFPVRENMVSPDINGDITILQKQLLVIIDGLKCDSASFPLAASRTVYFLRIREVFIISLNSISSSITRTLGIFAIFSGKMLIFNQL